jgi:2-amino-4-hydroxy-6-hydroxymethyldihydropteridine diphosphokinase
VSIEALLSLGGNMGDRKKLMDEAVTRIGALPGTSVLARSSYFRTEPVGPVEKQPWFLNIAVKIVTDLGRETLTASCRAIETALGRDRAREISWGPRTMDIDVVGYGGWSKVDDRGFVLIPLAEIAPDVVVEGKTLQERAAAVSRDSVQRLGWPLPSR